MTPTQETGGIGYLTTFSISAMHFQDIILAFVLGFVGAFGAFVFHKLFDKKKDR
jgi:hypothetical protein